MPDVRRHIKIQYYFAPQVRTDVVLLVTGMVPLTWKSTRLKSLQELTFKAVQQLHFCEEAPSIYSVLGWGTVAVPDPLPPPTAASRHPGQHPHPL